MFTSVHFNDDDYDDEDDDEDDDDDNNNNNCQFKQMTIKFYYKYSSAIVPTCSTFDSMYVREHVFVST